MSASPRSESGPADVPRLSDPTDAGAPATGTRLDSLTGLRFVAALMVVLGHTIANDVNPHHLVTIPFLRDIATIGFTGVSFFFVLSGFVLAWSSRDHDRSRDFWARRFARIYPMHALTWAISIPVLLYVGTGLGLGTALLCLVLLQAWSPFSSVVFGMNPLSWSLSCEAFFYAVFPFLHRALRDRPVRVLALVVGACGALLVIAPVIAYVVGGRGAVTYFYYFPLYRVLEFVIGVSLAVAVRRGWRPPLPSWCGPAAVVAALAFALVAAAWYRDAGHGNALPRVASTLILLPAFTVLIVLAAIRDADGKSSVFASRGLVRLGVWSFALYMTHLLMVRVLERWIGEHAVSGTAASVGLELAVLVVATLVAAAAYRFVEHPCERVLRRRLTRKPGVG